MIINLICRRIKDLFHNLKAHKASKENFFAFESRETNGSAEDLSLDRHIIYQGFLQDMETRGFSRYKGSFLP